MYLFKINRLCPISSDDVQSVFLVILGLSMFFLYRNRLINKDRKFVEIKGVVEADNEEN